jgi:hypothetical protein
MPINYIARPTRFTPNIGIRGAVAIFLLHLSLPMHAGDLLTNSESASVINAPLQPGQNADGIVRNRCVSYSADVVDKSRGSTRSYNFTCPEGMYGVGLSSDWSSLTSGKREGQFFTCCGK